MDLNELRDILNNDLLSDEIKKSEIINSLARDENVIPVVMRILESERRQKKEALIDMNELLSKSHMIIESPKLNSDNFIQKEIMDFYKKHKNTKDIHHCFKDNDTY